MLKGKKTNIDTETRSIGLTRIARKPVASTTSSTNPLLAHDFNRAFAPLASEDVTKISKQPFRWGWELGSLVMGAAAFIAIVITLRMFENKALENWRAPISINAVIAILSALFRGSLIVPISSGLAQLKWLSFSKTPQSFANMDTYDQASRGAWGSLLLLTRQVNGDKISSIATLGAVTAILLLVIEPFSQAAVLVAVCDRSTVGQASIPRYNHFAGASHTGARSAEMESSLASGVYQGLYDDFRPTSELMQRSVICSSGNCTFPQPVSLQTITVCHSCRDISERLRPIYAAAGVNPYTSVYGIDGYGANFSITPTNPADGTDFGNVLATNTSTNYDIMDKTVLWGEGPWIRTSISDFQGIALTLDNKTLSLGVGPTSKVKSRLAFDCSLRPCVTTYSAKVINGQYAEVEISREYMHVAQGRFELAVNKTFVNGTWRQCYPANEESESHDMNAALPPKWFPNGTSMPTELVWYPPECIYNMEFDDYVALYNFLTSTFTKGVLSWATGPQVTGDAWVKRLWNNNNPSMEVVNSFAATLANSIGTVMRTNGLKNYYTDDGKNITLPVDFLKATGDVHDAEPCIQVRWKFLSFLAILLFFELVFFSAIVFIDCRSRLWSADWKAAALPLLFQALEDKHEQPVDSRRTLHSRHDYYNTARSMEVKLVDGDEGWVFASARDG